MTQPVPPNSDGAGPPATVQRHLDSPLPGAEPAHELTFAWFGASIMEHLEGVSEELVCQAALPQPGAMVRVDGLRNMGYPERVRLRLAVEKPEIRFRFDNRASGGETSRDVLAAIESAKASGFRCDVGLFGAGINDVWRGFQGNSEQAVGVSEFRRNIRDSITQLKAMSRKALCIGETPFGWVDGCDVEAMNEALAEYNDVSRQEAADAGVVFVDVWTRFAHTVQLSRRGNGPREDVWSDGVHMAPFGDEIIATCMVDALMRNGIIDELSSMNG